MMLAVFVLGIWPVVAFGRRVRGTPAEMRVSRIYAVLIPCFTIPLQVIDFLPGNYDLQTTLPLQLCDFAWIAAVVALWTHRRTPVALTYFWGLALTTQALITPALVNDLPDPKFIAYWAMHLLIVWAAIFLTWGLGLHPTWRDYRRTVAITIGLGGGGVLLQRRGGHELRVPQPQAGDVDPRPAGSLAHVRRRGDRPGRRGLGADDLAVGAHPAARTGVRECRGITQRMRPLDPVTHPDHPWEQAP